MRFWDASAIVPLLVTEPSTLAAQQEYRGDPGVVVWWATELECVSALAGQEREGVLGVPQIIEGLRRLDQMSHAWREVAPVARVRRVAARLLRVHPLRTADALQLGAAIVAAQEQPASLPFVTLDDRLALAAEREGFTVVRPDRTS